MGCMAYKYVKCMHYLFFVGVYYTVIKHNRHLRTQGKCRKHELQVSVFYISLVFSDVWNVLSQCNKQLRLLHLLYDIEIMSQKNQ